MSLLSLLINWMCPCWIKVLIYLKTNCTDPKHLDSSVLCYVMLCYVMLCYVMLCYVMLCYVYRCRPILRTPQTTTFASLSGNNSRTICPPHTPPSRLCMQSQAWYSPLHPPCPRVRQEPSHQPCPLPACALSSSWPLLGTAHPTVPWPCSTSAPAMRMR